MKIQLGACVSMCAHCQLGMKQLAPTICYSSTSASTVYTPLFSEEDSAGGEEEDEEKERQRDEQEEEHTEAVGGSPAPNMAEATLTVAGGDAALPGIVRLSSEAGGCSQGAAGSEEGSGVV
ncbi:hypothetical protein NQZ68_021029, partial [Dissostichus eleginoides]